MLETGIAWNRLPAALVGCSGISCWRRLRGWTEAGIWSALHEQLARLRARRELNMEVCAIVGSHVRALKGGTHVGPSPADEPGLAASTT